MDKASRQIETGRYAMQILADEIAHAGYYGALANPPSMLSDPSMALLNRCADPLSILQSCNGISDRPVNAEHP